MGARLIGYDPALHSSSALWQQLRVQPVPLSELVSTADGVCVQMHYASRYQHFVGERVLAASKRGQVWVSVSRSKLFNAQAMADALKDGRVGAFMIDGGEDDFEGPESPLAGVPRFYSMPRLASNTREARVRASWYLAHRLHDALIGVGNSAVDSAGDTVTNTSIEPHFESSGLPSDQSASSWIDSAPPTAAMRKSAPKE